MRAPRDCVAEYEFSKVLAEYPKVGEMFGSYISPMGPDHDLWSTENGYGPPAAAADTARPGTLGICPSGLRVTLG